MTEKEHMPGNTDDVSLATILVMATDASVLKMLEMVLKVE